VNSVSYGVEVLKRGNNEVYPMPFFVALTVKDVAASTAWYRDVLGFVVMFAIPPAQPMMSHIRWIKFADLMLYPAAEQLTAPGQGVKLNFQVWPEDIALDELAAQMKAMGAEIIEGPVDRPWNTRDFIVHDPDGYLLTFTQVDFTRLGSNSAIKEMLEQGRPQ
jgi:catechol 2,3-dioxygenase-like lactoylglutathione lyase family enzyme